MLGFPMSSLAHYESLESAHLCIWQCAGTPSFSLQQRDTAQLWGLRGKIPGKGSGLCQVMSGSPESFPCLVL